MGLQVYKITIYATFLLFVLYTRTLSARQLEPILILIDENDKVELSFFIPDIYGINAKWKLFANSLNLNRVICEDNIEKDGTLCYESFSKKSLAAKCFFLVIYDSHQNIQEIIVKYIVDKSERESIISLIIKKSELIIAASFGFLLSIITFFIQERKTLLSKNGLR